MKLNYLFFIFIIVFIVGCIESTSSNQGVEIKTFEFVPDKISSGQKTLLSLELINKGAISIDNKDRKAYVSLYGIGTEWKLQKPAGITETISLDNKVIGPFELAASDPQYDLPAGEKSITFIVDSPKTLPKGQAFTYDFQARVCYDYYTEAVGKVELISEEEWLARYGEIKQHNIETTQTAGPLNIKIDSPQPLIVSSGGSEISLELELENVGGGTTAKPEYKCIETSNEGNINYAKISYILVGPTKNPICNINVGSCTGIDELDNTIFFSKGKTGKFVCSGTCTGDIPEQKLDLRVRFDYVYYKDAEARIEVKGV